MIPGPFSRPADTLGEIEVVVLLAISIEFAGEDEVGDFAAAGGRKRLVALDTVDVAIEDARIAGFAEEDQAVGKRFEPGFDSDFERLVRLGVVIPSRLVRAWEDRGLRVNEHH